MANKTSPVILLFHTKLEENLPLQQYLLEQSFQLLHARTSELALKLSLHVVPDLVLLRLENHLLDETLKLCQDLRSQGNYHEIPIIAINRDIPSHRLWEVAKKLDLDAVVEEEDQLEKLDFHLHSMVRLNRFHKIRSQNHVIGWLIEKSQDGFLTTDQEGYILQLNPIAAKHLKIDRADFKPQTLKLLDYLSEHYRLVPPETWQHWPDWQTGEKAYCVKPESKEEPPQWLFCRLNSFYNMDRKETLVQLVDITNQLEQRRNIWTFESMVAHKMRTPLSKMTWNLSLLSKKAPKMNTQQVKEFASLSYMGSLQLQQNLESILNYIHAPRNLRHQRACEINLLYPLANKLSRQLELEPLEVKVPKELRHHHLPISSKSLELILTELLANSKKFHPQRQPKIRISLCEHHELLTLSLQNDGDPIPESQLGRVWQPYYQSESEFTGRIPGIGLGLSMIASIVLEAGGDFKIQNLVSSPGVKVQLHFPKNPPQAPRHATSL